MKKAILITIAILGFALMASAQTARKPTIMVVPSAQWCNEHGYNTSFDNQGVVQKVADYGKALSENEDMRRMITKMGSIMADRGFPLVSLEYALRNLQNEEVRTSVMTSKEGGMVAESPIDRLNRTAKADILLDLSFDILRYGPQYQVSFNLMAVDAYSAKQIGGEAGVSSRSGVAPVETLLEEAVLSFMDKFTAQLDTYFDEMFEIGREVKISFFLSENAGFDFETEFFFEGDQTELGDILEIWFEDNSVAGRFSVADRSETRVKFDQVRMPLFITNQRGRQRAADTRIFIESLERELKNTYNIPVKRYPVGLGEMQLVLGE